MICLFLKGLGNIKHALIHNSKLINIVKENNDQQKTLWRKVFVSSDISSIVSAAYVELKMLFGTKTTSKVKEAFGEIELLMTEALKLVLDNGKNFLNQVTNLWKRINYFIGTLNELTELEQSTINKSQDLLKIVNAIIKDDIIAMENETTYIKDRLINMQDGVLRWVPSFKPVSVIRISIINVIFIETCSMLLSKLGYQS